jgi:hypothetical protein
MLNLRRSHAVKIGEVTHTVKVEVTDTVKIKEITGTIKVEEITDIEDEDLVPVVKAEHEVSYVSVCKLLSSFYK